MSKTNGHFFEPIKGVGWERRDTLGKTTYGDTPTKRPHPHLGEDWGFRPSSENKEIWAIHGGVVTKVYDNEALGWTAVIRNECDNSCGYNGFEIEYNHMIRKPALKVGQVLRGGGELVGNIGATGSALSASGANHLHASMGDNADPHSLPLAKKVALFPLIDDSKAHRKAIKDALVK